MADLNKIVDVLDELTPQELEDLVPELENRWGVNVNPIEGIQLVEVTPTEEEKTEWEVYMVSFGVKKVKVIMALRNLNQLGLQDAKKMVEETPVVLLSGADEATAKLYKEKLEEAGSKIELR
jgi:ribosomal protein L7/L12